MVSSQTWRKERKEANRAPRAGLDLDAQGESPLPGISEFCEMFTFMLSLQLKSLKNKHLIIYKGKMLLL